MRIALFALLACACASAPRAPADADSTVHRQAIVVDGHSDTTEAIVFHGYDFAVRHDAATYHEDLPRMRAGNLSAQFFAIWIDPKGEKKDFWTQAEHELIAAREKLASIPGIKLARTAQEVRDNFARGETSALFGVEGGHMLGPGGEDEQLARLRRFAELGVRYLTLTHTKETDLGGSSGDESEIKGLTDFGRRAVAEMERLGILIDISHVSDPMFWDVVRAAKKPVIASHSSSRQLANVPRNVTDGMAIAVAKTGGAVCVNYFPGFLDARYFALVDAAQKRLKDEVDRGLRKKAASITEARDRLLPLIAGAPRVTVSTLADHIQHLVKVAGVDHVCLGSDFDGIPTLPDGLEDVSRMPALTAELLRRGFSEADVRKVLGENFLRVLAAAER